jgi:hypothetical protein
MMTSRLAYIWQASMLSRRVRESLLVSFSSKAYFMHGVGGVLDRYLLHVECVPCAVNFEIRSAYSPGTFTA